MGEVLQMVILKAKFFLFAFGIILYRLIFSFKPRQNNKEYTVGPSKKNLYCFYSQGDLPECSMDKMSQ